MHTTTRSSPVPAPSRRAISEFSIDLFSTDYDDTMVLGPLAGYMTLVQHTITSESVGGHATMSYSNLKCDDLKSPLDGQHLICATYESFQTWDVNSPHHTRRLDIELLMKCARTRLEYSFARYYSSPIITPSPLPLQVKVGDNNPNRLTSLIIVSGVNNPNDNPST